ncbi:DUF1732 domain-containing protein [Candidatus Dependentiae bacterium]|nr:DUF1732 domain-containing protein [Candidatus Dependentiae bacterium]
MITSMTGFSSSIITITQNPSPESPKKEVYLAFSLKTLNSRFLEVNCKLPYSLAFLETELIKYFKKRLSRGTVQFSIYMSSQSALTGTIEPSLSTIAGYLAASKTIQETFNVEGALTLPVLLNLPNVFETREAPLEERFIERIMAEIDSLTDECIKTRIQEGKSLEKDLLERVENIQNYMSEVEPQTKKVIEQKKEHLFATLHALLKETNQETISDVQTSFIYNQLEKLDIHEEIVRTNNHLQRIHAIITSSEAESGKKLDFTLQELFREINTIASKCQDSLISNLSINIKVELEKAREQTQNVV